MRRVPICILVSVAAAAGSAAAAEFRMGQLVMGTVLEVTVIAPDVPAARRLAHEAVREAQHWDDVLTTWRSAGELARLNARSGAGPVAVSPKLAAALVRMQALAVATGGAFDPAVGPLVTFWRGSGTPTAAAPATVGPYRMSEALLLGPGGATLAAGAALDAGAIGKGIALDAMTTLLRSGGAQGAFLDFGGSSQLALGTPAAARGERKGDLKGWGVVIAGWAPGVVHGRLQLRDAALSTSRATGPGAEAGPIIDPRSGQPVGARRLVTVLAADAATADAWSTALVVRGRSGLNDARRVGIEALVEDDDGVTTTPGFRLQRCARPERAGGGVGRCGR